MNNTSVLCKVGDTFTAYTKGEERKVTGKVISVRKTDGYVDVGNTWTTDSGTEQWFVEIKK